MSSYNEFFYDELRDGSLSSARTVVPIVLSLIGPKKVESIVDIGCGIGTWLSVFKENGVQKITGVDGPWVKESQLLIPKEDFTPKDVEKPFSLDKKADLAVCLEMAEHVDAKHAPKLIETLTSIAPVILFSAAIPFQGGSHHVNEQWPQYWADLFAERGYLPVDCVRRKIWDNKSVSFFYSQNIFIYVSEDAIPHYPGLAAEITAGNGGTLPFVHPHKYLYYANRWELLVPVLGKIPPSILHKAKKMLGKLKKWRGK